MSPDANASPSLDDLIVAIAEHRDKHAFQQLFNETASRLKAFAIQCGASPADAEELLQECMLTVWRKAHTFKPKYGTGITWLYTIVRNKRIDFARKGRHEMVMSDDLWPEETGEELEKEVSGDLEGQVVRNMLEFLPDEQRQIVFKVYFEGKSHSEIANDLDLPLGTIKSRLRLAMKKLDTLAKEQMTWLIIILMTNF
ncbi:MAG: sigma-70 family RNA polymerase sigma factor [Oleiphilaceae bacterium]|nr:sigma-70 family RNA polymerase sigma factor [Oleiphilaceae bacterium]